jgi:peptidoglycan/LPS O-acetylase OafA/YrhL
MLYAEKAFVFVLTAVLGSNVAAALLMGDWTNPTVYWGVLITVLGSLAVFFKANTPSQPWAKRVLAVFTAVAMAIVAAATDHSISAAELAQILLVFLGAIQVGDVANTVRAAGSRAA